MHTAAALFSVDLLKFELTSCNQNAPLWAWQDVALIRGVACTFDLNIVPEVISNILEPMLVPQPTSIHIGFLGVLTNMKERERKRERERESD